MLHAAASPLHFSCWACRISIMVFDCPGNGELLLNSRGESRRTKRLWGECRSLWFQPLYSTGKRSVWVRKAGGSCFPSLAYRSARLDCVEITLQCVSWNPSDKQAQRLKLKRSGVCIKPSGSTRSPLILQPPWAKPTACSCMYPE